MDGRTSMLQDTTVYCIYGIMVGRNV